MAAEQLEPRILYSAAPVEASGVEESAASAQEAVAEAVPAPTAVAEEEAVTEAVTPVAVSAEVAGGELSAAQNVALVEVGGASAELNQQTVETLAAEARQRWIDSGISAEQIAALDSISYEIADVGGAHLGLASGFSITIDDDAGGNGVGNWFIDTTPRDDAEFGGNVSGAASGRYDLLSTLIHEQGHVLGLGDIFGTRMDVMDGFLDAGTRRLPVDGQANGATAGSLLGDLYLSAHTTVVSVDGGGNLIIEDVDGGDTNDNLFIGIVNGRLEISDSKNTVGTMIAGATEVGTKDRGVSIDLASFTGDIIVRTLGGDDVITIGDLSGIAGGVIVEDGMGQDKIRQTGVINLSGASGLRYEAEEIRMAKKSSVTVVDGSIELWGNLGDTSTKKSVGVYANGSTLSVTGTGGVDIDGTGGIAGSGNRGVDLRNTDITVGTGLNVGGGDLHINGVGGNGVSNNEGVRTGGDGQIVVFGASSNLTIVGTGNGTGNGNRGVKIQSGGLVQSDAALTIFGTAGAGNSSNVGTEIGFSTVRATGSQAVQVSGSGSGSGSNNVGLVLKGAGISSDSAQVTVFGFGSSTADGSGNRGIEMKNASIYAGGGNVSVSALGGSGRSSNSGVRAVGSHIDSQLGSTTISGTALTAATQNGNRGINFLGGSISAATNLTVTANGGNGVSSNEGLRLISLNLRAGGTLNITGSASTMTTGSSNRGIFARNLELSGSDVSFIGRAGNGTNNNEGLRFLNSIALASTGSVLLQGEGFGTTTGSGNRGGYLSKVTARADDNVDVIGNGGGGINSNSSLYLNASLVRTTTGSVNLSGSAFGVTTGKGNYGALIRNSDVSAGTSTLVLGTAGSGTSGNSGLTVIGGFFENNSTTVSFSGSADGGTTGVSNYGTRVSGAVLGASDAVSVFGLGGGGTNSNYGTRVQGVTATSTVDAVSVDGVAALSTTGKGNFGALITSTDLNATSVILNGFGGRGTSGNFGLSYTKGMVTAATANLTITGIADAATTGSGNSGVSLKNVEASSGDGAAVFGFGGGGISKNHGVRIDGGHISNTANDFVVSGRADANTSGSNNFGVRGAKTLLFSGGKLTVIGDGGGGKSSNFGVFLSNSVARSLDEAVISGSALSSTTGRSNYGSYFSKTDVEGTNLIDIDGNGGGGTNGNWGVRIVGGRVQSAAGNTDIDGMASGTTTGTGNSGVYIFNGVLIQAGLTISVDGTGGGGTGSNFGVFMNKSITAFGAVVTGMATDGVSDDEAGNFFPTP